MAKKDQEEMSANESPDFFAAPKKGRGVRRLNKIPLIVVGGVLVSFCAAVTYTFHLRNQDNLAAATAKKSVVSSVATAPIRPEGPDYVAMPEPPAEPVIQPPVAPDPIPQSPSPPPSPPMEQEAAPPPGPSEEYLERMRLIKRIEEKRFAAMEAALDADVSVQNFRDNNRRTAQGATPPAPGNPGPSGMGMPPMAGMPTEAARDPNGQAQKRAFLSGSAEASTYLAHTRVPAISNVEIKAGTIIPGVLISGVNSDLPGQIIGQVRENVYDTATGQHLLIPAGSRLIGTYDNGVTMGQSRALVAWSRIIYPDASSLLLDIMPGTDQSGYAGFNDKVNNHYLRIFGSGILLSLISAGAQLSQPQSSSNSNSNSNYDARQILAAEMGRQMSQVGTEMIRRNMDIQPTLEIRPGYLFNIMVTKDIIIPPWRGHPMAVGQ